jgi:putative toxin-antitoxin system antitoxin component (TIGR02293 family)
MAANPTGSTIGAQTTLGIEFRPIGNDEDVLVVVRRRAARKSPAEASKSDPDAQGPGVDSMREAVFSAVATGASPGLDVPTRTIDAGGDTQAFVEHLNQAIYAASAGAPWWTVAAPEPASPGPPDVDWDALAAAQRADTTTAEKVLGLTSNVPATGPGDPHAIIVEGLPYAALFNLVDESLTLEDVAEVVGISVRTLHRYRNVSAKQTMQPDMGSRVWQLAETLAKATDLMGGRQQATQWLKAPANRLDGHSPIDLLRTSQGAAKVASYLNRMDYGVYT